MWPKQKTELPREWEERGEMTRDDAEVVALLLFQVWKEDYLRRSGIALTPNGPIDTLPHVRINKQGVN